MTLPASWRYEASSGPSPPACSMPWTPPRQEPGSPTRWSWSSAVLAAYSGAWPCTCPRRRGRQPQEAQGTVGGIACRGTLGPNPAVSTGQPRTVPASQQSGRWRFPTPRRRSQDRSFRALRQRFGVRVPGGAPPSPSPGPPRWRAFLFACLTVGRAGAEPALADRPTGPDTERGQPTTVGRPLRRGAGEPRTAADQLLACAPGQLPGVGSMPGRRRA
jgi:hypothetical protein